MDLDQVGEVVYAIHDFDASVEDEISLIAGEPILVLEKDELYNDGWWQGKNSRGEVGLFPMNFISYKNINNDNMMDRYANLLNDQNAQDNISNPVNSEPPSNPQSLNLRLSDPINEQANSAVFQLSVIPEPEKPIINIINDNNNNIINNININNEIENGLTRSISTKSPIKENFDIIHKRTLTSSQPLTPNRSSYRKSVRMSTVNDSIIVSDLPNPMTWDNDMVVSYLNTIGFKELEGTFKEHEITGSTLLNLDLNTLKDLGILAFGKRFNLNNHINNLKIQYQIQLPNKVDDEILLTDKMNDMDISNVSDSNLSTVEKWLQQSSDYDYDHNLFKEAGITTSTNQLKNEQIVDLSTSSDLSSPTNLDQVTEMDYKFPPTNTSNDKQESSSPPILKKQVSFSQNNPEVIGISETHEDDENDEEAKLINSKGSQGLSPFVANPDIKRKNPPPPQNSSSTPRLDLFDQGDRVVTHNLQAEPTDPSIPTTPTGISIQGHLKKQEGSLKLWKTRYCILNGTLLQIWDSNKLKKLKGSFDLKGYKPVLDPSLCPGKFGFRLITTNGKGLGFASDEMEEVRGWMKQLMKISIDRDLNAPVVTSCTVNTVPLHVARKLAPRPPSAMYQQSNEEQNPNFI